MNAGYVYVLAFANGTVKVGRTQNTSQRLNAHKSAARKFGLTVTSQWLSPAHAEWRENEETLKAIAASLGGTAHSKEYFGGVDFAAVVAEAERLPFTRRPALPDAAPAAPRITPGAVSPRDRAIKLAYLKVRRDEAREAFDALVTECLLTEAANIFLNNGTTPAEVRKMAMTSAGPYQPYLDMADAMEAQIREEAALEAHLIKAVA